MLAIISEGMPIPVVPVSIAAQAPDPDGKVIDLPWTAIPIVEGGNRVSVSQWDYKTSRQQNSRVDHQRRSSIVWIGLGVT